MKRLVYLIIFILSFALFYCGDDNAKDSSDKNEITASSSSGLSDGKNGKNGKTSVVTSNPNDYLVDDLKNNYQNDYSNNASDSKNRIRNISDLRNVLEDDFYKPENFKDNAQKKWQNSEDVFEEYKVK